MEQIYRNFFHFCNKMPSFNPDEKPVYKFEARRTAYMPFWNRLTPVGLRLMLFIINHTPSHSEHTRTDDLEAIRDSMIIDLHPDKFGMTKQYLVRGIAELVADNVIVQWKPRTYLYMVNPLYHNTIRPRYRALFNKSFKSWRLQHHLETFHKPQWFE